VVVHCWWWRGKLKFDALRDGTVVAQRRRPALLCCLLLGYSAI
jgi:hypothetical protein